MTVGVLMLAYLFFGILSLVTFRSDRKWLSIVAMAWGLLLCMLHGLWIVMRGVRAGHWPFTNTYETLVLLGFLIMGTYFMMSRGGRRLIAVGAFAGIITSLLLALASFLSPEIEPLLPALKSNWLLFHVVSSFIGYSAFALAAASALAYLGLSIFPVLFFHKKDPEHPLAYLDWITYRLVAFGFAFLTLGIVTGAVWANLSWGRYWNWDPKETWAFITWAVYAVCLHMRYDERLRGKAAAIMTLVGFATVLFTYFGVNFWLASLHASYA